MRGIALGQTRLTARNQLERRIVRNSLPSLGSKIQDWQCCVDNPQTALQSYRRLVDICYGHVNFFSSLGSWFLGQPLLLAHCALCVLVTICANLALPHATFLAGKVSLRDALNFTPSTNLPLYFRNTEPLQLNTHCSFLPYHNHWFRHIIYK